MHTLDDFDSRQPSGPGRGPWFKELNRYHWFVLIVAALGWMFDCLDQQIFILARQPAMRDLVPVATSRDDVMEILGTVGIAESGMRAEFDTAVANVEALGNEASSRDWSMISERFFPKYVQGIRDGYSGYATAIFLLGWASGGLFFGVLGDRIGRAKTMVITILMYSLFTGLSSISFFFWDFTLYRFLTGLGVGGEFAVGVALVAEVMPERARAYALSLLQALSAFGNISAALLTMGAGELTERGLLESVWRPLFVVGAIPALLALVIRRRLKEPERWQQVSHQGGVTRQLGSYRALFSDPRWRKNALIGLGLAFSGVVGLWAVGFFTMDLVGNVLTTRFTQEGLPEAEVRGRVAFWKGITSLMINGGAFLGMFSFGIVTQRLGRKITFAIAFLAAFFSTLAVFAFLDQFWQIFVLVPIMGFCQLSLFAGYAIYFPELFPTYLRSTGTSFCYNVGRFVAALGPAALALLTTQVYADTDEPLRYAGLTMCSIFLVGLLVLPFAPETKGKPLPE